MRDGASRIGERHQLTAYRPFMSPALLRYDDRFAAEAVSSEAGCDRQQPLHCPACSGGAPNVSPASITSVDVHKLDDLCQTFARPSSPAMCGYARSGSTWLALLRPSRCLAHACIIFLPRQMLGMVAGCLHSIAFGMGQLPLDHV